MCQIEYSSHSHFYLAKKYTPYVIKRKRKLRQNGKLKLASIGVQHTTKTICMAALVFCDCLHIQFARSCTSARCVSFILVIYQEFPYCICTKPANKNTRLANCWIVLRVNSFKIQRPIIATFVGGASPLRLNI